MPQPARPTPVLNRAFPPCHSRNAVATSTLRPVRHPCLIAVISLMASSTYGKDIMASLTVRGLDQETKSRLRVRAAQHGRSMEAEVRAIIQQALAESEPRMTGGLGTRIHARFAALGGVELELPARNQQPRAAIFE
ncbi:MAG TPA: Arc family DNA-binding protein [Streptosporangiaceae bacterium]